MFCCWNECTREQKCDFFERVSSYREVFQGKIHSGLIKSQKGGFFNVTDILKLIICRCEETVLSIIRCLATSLQTVEQNSFSGEPQLLRVISKGIKCTAHILCKTTPLKPAILLLFSYLSTMKLHLLLTPFFKCFSIQLTPLPWLLFSWIPFRFVPSFLNYWKPDVCSVW